jgi:NADH-quinone oxidoreductase subunit D
MLEIVESRRPEPRAPGSEADALPIDHLTVQMGPSHPAMHGVVRIELKLDGETVVDADVTIGYMHRAFEKMAEISTYTQVIPYTDRLNYVSPLINNVGYVMCVEKLLEIEVPPRCQYIRVLVSEMSRITDHLTCVGAMAMELAAFTAFLYFIKAREYFYELVEDVCGARLTTTYTRVGGLSHDLPEGFGRKLKKAVADTREVIEEVDALLSKNRIFYDRTRGVGVVTAEEAIGYGWSGPCLRACGVPYDLRKNAPYLVYPKLDFQVPTRPEGDTYARYEVRLEEMRQSLRLLEQVVEGLPEGPFRVSDPRISLPDKSEVYNSIEGLMNHFKLIIEGVRVPPGEAYFAVEGANGELGYYIVADGSGRPYRCRSRSPGFALVQGLRPTIRGGMLADIVPVFGSLNYIAGEVER